ncbi:glycosyl hydrolase [Mycobacterium haemophilum DSM 44634]|uniref:trehalase-like domain-containing protein n=1 Tax=Mycobacterium haemophilum TaxID=29311 RepID=UPI0006D3CD82|nr:trehalase-like domain-containing protein [Mycobacterium haemophilum]ALL56290.1 hypothetical protein B586_09715 [Mycobacterium haemophilum DSM 44634]MCV7340129.1 hypothetical protein [Mycobacterium haemophilum DSM 44634]
MPYTDGERGVVVGPRGDYCWMCLLRWHSGAVFNSLLGGAGLYVVAPEAQRFVWGGPYEQRSLIWRSRWVTSDGIIECRVVLAQPADPHTAVLLRRIHAIDGHLRMRITLDILGEFGNYAMSHLSSVDVDGDLRWVGRSGPCRFRWTEAHDAKLGEDGSLHAVVDVLPGRDHDLVLEFSDHELAEVTI